MFPGFRPFQRRTSTMKAISKLMVLLGLVALTFTAACEKKEEATTEAPAAEGGAEPAAAAPTTAAQEEKPAEGEPAAPPASQ